MSTPEGQNLSVGPLDIDLGTLLSGPGSTSVSMQSVEVGMSADSSIDAGVGVDLSIGAPGGVPQVSAAVSGGVSAESQASVGGSYDSVDLTTDAATGTTELSAQSADAGLSGYAGGGFGAGVEVNIGVGDAGIPEIGISGGADYGSYSGYDAQIGYEEVEIQQDGGDASYLG